MRRIDYIVKYDIIVKYLDKGNILFVTLCVADKLYHKGFPYKT